MENTLTYIFNSYAPIRCSILSFLKPSEIMGLCMATKSILTDDERRIHMNPLKEIFYSFEWVNELQSSGGKLALVGSGIDRLCNPKYKQVKLLCLVHRNTPESAVNYGLLLQDTYWADKFEHYTDSEKIQSKAHIYDDVELRPMTYSHYYPYVGRSRVILHFCIVDNIRFFILSFNAILEVIVDADNIPILDSVESKGELEVPYMIYSNGEKYTKISSIRYTVSITRNCRACRYIVARFISITSSPLIPEMDRELSNVMWRYWEENSSCARHVTDKLERNCIYWPH